MNLETLLGSIQPASFLADYWSKKPLHVRGTTDKYAGLYDLQSFQRTIGAETPASVRLDKAWQERCWQAYGRFVDLKISSPDELGLVMLAGTTTATVSVDADERITRLSAELTHALGLTGSFRVHAWLSMPGAGIRTHFDASSNFVLQLAGKKRWRMSPEPVVRSPRFLAVYGPGGEIQYGEMEAHESDYAGSRRVPESEFNELELEPGDTLYLPPGVWHGTEATSKEPSLAISFRLIDRGFALVAAALIEECFRLDEKWRQVPAGLLAGGSAAEMPAHVRDYFSLRLRELREALDQVDPFTLNSIYKRMVAAQEGSRAAKPFATPELEPEDVLCVAEDRVISHAIGEDAAGTMRMNIYCGDKEISLRDERLFGFGVKLIRSGQFRAGTTLDWLAGTSYSWPDVRAFLLGLIGIGLLKKTESR